jgi:NAD(P)-dependent dehydrogenase (short-subunit alcohol dehydrogenase family)
LGLDVSDPQQRVAALQQAEARFGAIDFLVNNAGIDFLGAIEEQDEADYRKIFEVNLFGAVALLRLALPVMRARPRYDREHVLDGWNRKPARQRLLLG